MQSSKILLFLIVTFILPSLYGQEQPGPDEKNLKIGLVLSGGGAKGMAHVGVLKVLEELEIRPDYITGTSMGSIVGGLYAIGYSALEIENILLNQDWMEVLSNDMKISDININEKDKYGQYFLEFPVQGRDIKLPKGLIFGQRIMDLLTHYTLPSYSITDFDSLAIPFKCIGADITNGDAVILDTGSLAMAMRASMAIPTVFTPVLWGDRLLVDGGLSRNFPVQEVIDMGANVVIGSYTGGVLKNKDELSSMLDVMQQAAFFMGVLDAKDQKKKVDIYIEPDLAKYKASDFNAVDSIIMQGEKAARNSFSELQELSLQLKKQKKPKIGRKLVMPDSIVVADIVTNGVEPRFRNFVLASLGIELNVPFTITQLENGINRVYGSQYFYQVSYLFSTNRAGDKVLVLSGIPKPKGFVGVAIHYDSEKRTALLVNGTIRDFLLPASRLSLTANISENPGFQVDYFAYVGRKRRFTFGAVFNNDAFDVPVYTKGDLYGLFKFNYVSNELYSHYILTNDSRLTAGFAFERTVLKPKVLSGNEFSKWQLNNKKLFVGFDLSTTNRRYFATRGIDMSLTYEYNFDMLYSISLLNNQSYNSKRIFNKTMGSFVFHFNYHQALYDNISLSVFSHAGFTLGDNYTLVKQFSAGGVFTAYSYLIPFVGFNELEYNSNQIAMGGMGVQYEPFKNIFVEPLVNVLLATDYVEDFVRAPADVGLVLGYGIQIGYASLIGPVLVNVSSNSYNKKLRAYFNLGYRFRF